MEKLKKQKKPMKMTTKNALTGYLYILPFIIGFVVFFILPLAQSLRMSFMNVSFDPSGEGLVYNWNNFYNYKYAFTVDADFTKFLREDITAMVLSVPSTLIFSFFIALLLNQEFKGRGFVRAIFFLPVILSSGVIVGLEFSNTLMAGVEEAIAEASNMNSITNVIKEIIGSDWRFLDYVFDAVDKIYDIAIQSGIQIIIFLSGLQTISPSMFEAARIEGATAWESFWKITFPMISSLILVNTIYSIIDYFTRSDSQTIVKIKEAISKNINYGFASAMSWAYFLIIAAIIGVVTVIISKRVYYYE